MVDNRITEICTLIRSLDKDNDSAYGIFDALVDHFDLAGTIWTDDDIVEEWKHAMDDDDFEPTQAQIKAVKDTSYWVYRLSCDCGYDQLRDAVKEVRDGHDHIRRSAPAMLKVW